MVFGCSVTPKLPTHPTVEYLLIKGQQQKCLLALMIQRKYGITHSSNTDIHSYLGAGLGLHRMNFSSTVYLSLCCPTVVAGAGDRVVHDSWPAGDNNFKNIYSFYPYFYPYFCFSVSTFLLMPIIAITAHMTGPCSHTKQL